MRSKLFWFLSVPEQGYKIIVCEFALDSKFSYELTSDFFTANEIGQLMGGN